MVHAYTVSAPSVAEPALERLFSLFSAHYGNVDPQRFRDDFAQKSDVILVEDERGELQGFSTLVVWPVRVDGARARVLFSGDTVIDRRHWGTPALAFEWLRLTSNIYASLPEVPLYWLLCCKSPRTYRYLSLFYRRFFPGRSGSHAEPEASLAADVCAARFGERYDRQRNIVRAEPGSAFLRPEFAEMRDVVLGRADLEAYRRLNPGYVVGDELACVARIAPDNHRPSPGRRFSQGMGAAVAGAWAAE